MSFIDVEVTTDEQTLADGAIDGLQVKWPDWEPNEADLEVAILEAVASMAADAAVTAGQVPSAVFRAFGTVLHGIPYEDGSFATATLEFTLSDTNGQTIPAGTEIDIDGFVFATDQDVDTAVGQATVEIAATATEAGVDFNSLPGDVVTPISSLARVASVAALAPTAGGTDPETDVDYQDRLGLELQLRGRTLVTLRDYELMALTHPQVDRAVAEHLGARAVRVTAIFGGAVLPTAVKDELLETYAALRIVNVTVTMADPVFTAVSVTYTVKAYPGHDPAALEANINLELETRLSPAIWGTPREFGDVASARWYNEPRVRKNKLIDIIGDIAGVDYVDTLTLAAATSPVTAVAATDVFTLNGHSFAADQRVVFSAITGGAGIVAGTTYFARDVTANTFKVAATAGGAAVNVTSDMTAGQVAPAVETGGDLILPGNVPLPTPGTMDGTIT